MFSLGSLSSISLATVTPSLVIVGLPNFLSMTMLRPFGPSVALTAAAMMLMPLSRLARASSSNFSCFGIAHVPPYSRMARTSSSRMIRYSLSSSFTSEPEYFPKRILSPALTSSGTFLPSSVTLPLPTAMTLPSWGFSFAVSGMMIPPFLTSFSSSRSTRRRSCNGRIFIGRLPPSDFGIRPTSPRAVQPRHPASTGPGQGLEHPAPHEAPAETEDDVPAQPVPSALHGDPGQPAAHQSDENRRPEHFEMHDSFSLTGCSGLAPCDLA